MPDHPPQRVYSEDEIGHILKRASDLQGAAGSRITFGLTLAELQQLARDSDIDPSFIAAAALELVHGDDPAKSTTLGGPLTLTLKRQVPGHISDEAWRQMISSARRHFGVAGQSSEVGSTREWSTESELSFSASFSLREREGATEIEVFWSERMLQIPFIVVPLLLCVLSLPVIFEALHLGVAGVPVLLIWMSLVGSTARFAFGKAASAKRRGVGSFTDSLVALADVDRAGSGSTSATGITHHLSSEAEGVDDLNRLGSGRSPRPQGTR